MFVLSCAVVLLLVAFNGVFAMSELAVVSARRSRLQSRADRGDAGAAAAINLAEHPARFLSAIQVGITLVGILAGAYGEATIARPIEVRFEAWGMDPDYAEAAATALVVVTLTYLSVIIGELVPKRVALLMPESIAAAVSRPLALLATIMGPFLSMLTASTSAALWLLRIREVREGAITQEEVEIVLAEGAGAGLIEPEEQRMMQEVMRLGDRTIRVAMTPRTEVYWVSLDDPPDVIQDEIRACPYSRFVVTRGQGFEDALGVAHKRDVADALLAGLPLDLERIVQEPLIIPETTSLLRAMSRFKTSASHMAFVVDEYGSVEGVVTAADLLEMIAGDFHEPHDAPSPGILEREDGSYLVDGRTDVMALGDVLGEALGEAHGFHTVAGLILDRLGRFPRESEVVPLGRYEAEIVEMDDRRIDKLIVRLADPSR